MDSRPYIDTTAAEKLFRHKIIHLLKNKGLLSDERIEILNAFRRSGFSVDCSVTVWPQDTHGLVTCRAEALAKADGWPPIYFVAPSASPASIGLPAPRPSSTNPMALVKIPSTPIPMEKRSTSSSFCGGYPFAGSPATSDSFEAAPKRTISRSSPHTDPTASQTQHPSLWHRLIEIAGVSSQEPPFSTHKRSYFTKANRLHSLPTKAGRTEKTMGSFDPTRLPYRPSHLSRLWRRAPRHCLHHRTQNHSKNLAPLAESKGCFSCSPYSTTST
jgi:hypothetical protein